MSAKRTIGIVLAVGLAYVVIKGVINAPAKPTSSTGSTYTASAPATEYPESTATYNQVNADIGCKSTYSDQKKWKCEIALLESDELSLNVDGIGTQDLQADFADKQAGYDLSKGSQLKLRFLMKTAGGCFLPFSGEDATVVR